MIRPSRRSLVLYLSLVWLFVIRNWLSFRVPTRPVPSIENSIRDVVESFNSINDDVDRNVGLLSRRPKAFFDEIRRIIDSEDPDTRCRRYGYRAGNKKKKRRIFYGSLIADEPWELFHIVATEVFEIFEGIAFVEGNRTQNLTPREFKHLNDTQRLQKLFGSNQLQVRRYVNEDRSVRGLDRENFQRSEILKGWKEMGMTGDDVGYLADLDETFSREFLRAVQVCDRIPQFDHGRHHCKHVGLKLISNSRVFESSPECIARGRSWFHPGMIIGACVEGIANETHHPPALREGKSSFRKKGYGNFWELNNWSLEKQIKDNRYPSWNAADFRMVNFAGSMPVVNRRKFPSYSRRTGYHFHNFFDSLESLRHKYRTYGHPDEKAYKKRLGELNTDIEMMIRCVTNEPDTAEQQWKRVPGYFDGLKQPLPIHFLDKDYRKRRHEAMRDMVLADEAEWQLRNNKTKGLKSSAPRGRRSAQLNF